MATNGDTQQHLVERIGKLEKINQALMGQVERSMDFSGGAFSLFQTAIVLENEVKGRTKDLEETLDDLSSAYTKLRQVTDEAESAKQNLTSAIEAVSEGFALFDEDEQLILCNAPYRESMPDVSAYLEPGVPFETIADKLAHSRSVVLDKGLTAAQWKQFRLQKFRSPYSSFVQRFKDDRWIQISNRRTGAGTIVVLQTDISDLMRQEREHRARQLDEQSKLLQATIDQLPQGICMFSNAGELKAWNNRFITMLQIPVRTVRPLARFVDIWHNASSNALARSASQCEVVSAWAKSAGKSDFPGIEIERSDGATLWVSCSETPDDGFVISFDDVTAQKQANKILHDAKDMLEQSVAEKTIELSAANDKLSREVAERKDIAAQLEVAKNLAEEANQSKTRFLAAASHDLLQPLDAARLFLSLLTDTCENDGQRHYAERTDMAFATIESLLVTLLDISRYDSGAVVPEPVPFSLDGLLRGLFNESQPLAGKKNLELVYVPTSLKIISDPNLLRRIVQNYIANAIRYSKSGRILLGVRRRDNSAEIQVVDTGPGIPADQLEQIFLEFKRLPSDDGKEQDEVKAMGLGLNIVSRIARLLSHEISVQSRVGKGSCFTVTVPADSIES